MRPIQKMTTGLLAIALFLCRTAPAEEVDPATLYELSTEGTSKSVRAGQQGTFVLTIRTRGNSHVSDEAPLKLELASASLKLNKAKLVLADSVAKKEPGKQYAEPRFEVPFTAAAAGKTTLEGKLSFFICTEKLCARQQKTLSIPVDVL